MRCWESRRSRLDRHYCRGRCNHHAAAEERFTRVKPRTAFLGRHYTGSSTGLAIKDFDQVKILSRRGRGNAAVHEELDLEKEFLEQAESSRMNALIREAAPRVPRRNGCNSWFERSERAAGERTRKKPGVPGSAAESVVSRTSRDADRNSGDAKRRRSTRSGG